MILKPYQLRLPQGVPYGLWYSLCSYLCIGSLQFGYSYNPLLLAGTLTAHEDPRDLIYRHTPLVHSIVRLHCLGG